MRCWMRFARACRRFLPALVVALALDPVPRAAGPEARADNPHGPKVGECGTCHGPEGWIPVRIAPSFDHSKLGFALHGAHSQTSCRGCHLSLVLEDVPVACASCHADVHQDELGNDCARCHTARSFIDRTRMARAHLLTRFPLTGAHSGLDCEDCHRPGVQGTRVYVNRRAECEACHLDDYLATTDPDHQALGFSRDCTQCHVTVAFLGARFPDHDALFFPIYSGTHRGKWTSCSDCHVNPSNRADFSCFLGCHAHSDETKVTNQHQGVSGFSYDSSACYGCHPQGKKP